MQPAFGDVGSLGVSPGPAAPHSFLTRDAKSSGKGWLQATPSSPQQSSPPGACPGQHMENFNPNLPLSPSPAPQLGTAQGEPKDPPGETAGEQDPEESKSSECICTQKCETGTSKCKNMKQGNQNANQILSPVEFPCLHLESQHQGLTLGSVVASPSPRVSLAPREAPRPTALPTSTPSSSKAKQLL